MSDDALEDEFEQNELEYENLLASLNSVGSLERSVLESKKIDRMTMESLHKLAPEAIDKNYPLQTFTTTPSEQNYEVALESFSVAKSVAIAAIGGILGAILLQLINVFRSNKVDVRSEYLDKKKDSIKDDERTMKKTLGRVKKLKLSPEDQIQFDAIESWNLDVYVGKPIPTSKPAEDFIAAASPGGKFYRIMDKWSSDIVKHTSEFKKRVRLMAEIVEVMYDVRGSAINDLESKAKSITLDAKDPFIRDMTEVDLFFRSLASGDSITAFINEQVVGTQEFRDLFTNTDTVLSFDKLYSHASAQIEKNMNDIQKKYAPILQGNATGTALKKAKSAARAKSSTDEVSMGQNAAVLGMINPMLMRAVQDAEQSLMKESNLLRAYVHNLEVILFFYQKASSERETIQRSMMRALIDIENRGQ